MLIKLGHFNNFVINIFSSFLYYIYHHDILLLLVLRDHFTRLVVYNIESSLSYYNNLTLHAHRLTENYMHVDFKVLGRRGLLDLLGMRKTVGSVDMWPPKKETLIQSFNSLHTKRY